MKAISLNGTWQAWLDPANIGLAENIAAKPLRDTFPVQVPGCLQQVTGLAEAYPSASGMQNGYKGTWFLEKVFVLPEIPMGMRCVVTLGGVSPLCHIWLNGHYVGRHHEPMCEARLEVTRAALANAENCITLAVLEEQGTTMIGGFRSNGCDWSGLYREASVYICPPIWEEGLCVISDASRQDAISSVVHNDSDEAWSGTIRYTLAGRSVSEDLCLSAGECREIALRIDTSGLDRWRPDRPNLHALQSAIRWQGEEIILQSVQVGLRRLHTDGPDIRMDEDAMLLLGCGQEYFSPTISPLVDADLIGRRYRMMRQFGFNFFRFHTYVPTEEELSAADEVGLMLSVEIGLVSNFHKVTPFEKGMQMLRHYILLTRRHPSLILYCLGNEGSQLMIASASECEHARLGYELVKESTASQLCMIAFGMQGELPELPNDIESPHLWSENFLWAYEGLTDIPWKALSATTHGKPALVHEYGKFGVWPDPREQSGYPEYGMRMDTADQAREVLEELVCAGDLQALIDSSRRHSVSCTRIILEEARRQPFLRGYALWTFFRKMAGNAGLCDDMARYPDCNPSVFREGCNAPVSILIDRGFRGRSFLAGRRERIEVTLSNFSGADIDCASLEWRFQQSDGESANGKHRVSAAKDRTQPAVTLTIAPPMDSQTGKASLRIWLTSQANETLAQNAWDFWVFAQDEALIPETLLLIEGGPALSLLKRALPGAQRLQDAYSILAGCYSWHPGDTTGAAARIPGAVALADRWDERSRTLFEQGTPLLMLENGAWPGEWILPPIMQSMAENDPSRFFSSFRAGWDSGNLATIIRDPGKILGDFPHEGFCDLPFYELIQRAAPMDAEKIRQSVGGEASVLIECLTKLRVGAQQITVVQDPNATKEMKALARKRTFAARRQAYLLEIQDGTRRILLCSLRLLGHPAGETLLRALVRSLGDRDNVDIHTVRRNV